MSMIKLRNNFLFNYMVNLQNSLDEAWNAYQVLMDAESASEQNDDNVDRVNWSKKKVDFLTNYLESLQGNLSSNMDMLKIMQHD